MSKTTQESSIPPWDERGTFLDALTINFFIPDDQKWPDRLEEMGLPINRSPKVFAWESSFSALPAQITEASHYLNIEVHPHRRENSTKVHWSIKYRSTPTTTPPDSITASSIKVGGFPNAWNRIVQKWPNAIISTADITATYAIDPKKFICNVPTVYRRKLKTHDGESFDAVANALSWNIEPPQRGIFKVIVVQSDQKLVISTDLKRERLEITENLLQAVEESVLGLITGLFIKKRTKSHARLAGKSTKREV